MFLSWFIIFGVFFLGFILYRIADYYAHKYLGFNSIDHTPECANGSSNVPILVCVLGWGGCKRRHLRRLLEFYSSNNITTISWINPMYNCVLGIDIKHVERVLDFLLNENRASKNIIIHLHSNNGALVWSSMLNIMKTNQRYRELLPNIKGIIFDSAPFIRLHKPSDWIIEAAVGTSKACVSIILNRVQYFHIIWSPLMVYYLCIRIFYKRYLSSNSFTPGTTVRELLDTIPVNIKQYFIYGEGDRLISPYSIGKLFS